MIAGTLRRSGDAYIGSLPIDGVIYTLEAAVTHHDDGSRFFRIRVGDIGIADLYADTLAPTDGPSHRGPMTANCRHYDLLAWVESDKNGKYFRLSAVEAAPYRTIERKSAKTHKQKDKPSQKALQSAAREIGVSRHE